MASESNALDSSNSLASNNNSLASSENPFGGSENLDRLFSQSPWGSLEQVGITSFEQVFGGVAGGGNPLVSGGSSPFAGGGAGGSNPFAGGAGGSNPFAGGGNPFASGGGNPLASGGGNPFAGGNFPASDGTIQLPFGIGSVSLTEDNATGASSNETIGNGNWHFEDDNTTVGNGNWYFGSENSTLGNGNWYFGNDNATVGNGNWYVGRNNTILGDQNKLDGNSNIVIGNPLSDSSKLANSDGKLIVGSEDWMFAANRDAISSDVTNEIKSVLDKFGNNGASTDGLNAEIDALTNKVGQDFLALISKDFKFGQSPSFPGMDGGMGAVAVPEPSSTLGMLAVAVVSTAVALRKRTKKQ